MAMMIPLQLCMPILVIPGLIIFISSLRLALAEEKLLRQVFGTVHIEYTRRVRRFIPKDWKKYLI